MPQHKMARLRVATRTDAEALAAMHAASWRSAYRGSFSDVYLDGPIGAERQSFWQNRYDHPPHGLWTVIAEAETGKPSGFLCLLADHDPDWGTLIDNLHVAPDLKRQGIGRTLMQAAGQHLLQVLPPRPVYLFVLQRNAEAMAFYERIGGQRAEALVETTSDGSQLPVHRYAWPSAALLLERIA